MKSRELLDLFVCVLVGMITEVSLFARASNTR